MNQAPDGIFIADLSGRYVEVNQPGCDMLGLRREDIIGKTIRDFIPPHDFNRLTDNRHKLLCGRGSAIVDEWQLRHKDGHYVPVEVSSNILANGQWQALVRDITQRRATENYMRLTSVVIDNTREAVMVTDAGKNIIMINTAFSDITGYSAAEVTGKKLYFLLAKECDDSFYTHVIDALNQHGQWQGEVWNERKNGESFAAWVNLSVAQDQADCATNYVCLMADISDLKKAEAELSMLAYSDSLTGLANRAACQIRLAQSLAHAKRNGHKTALLTFDLNRFKLINDTLGHDAGDRVLKTVAERLKHCVRDEDTVARLGGDEFTIILEQISDQNCIIDIVNKLIAEVAKPIQLDSGETIVTSTSVGISVYPDNAASAQELEKAADIAMYRTKNSDAHSFAFFADSMTNDAIERMTLEQDLRKALDENQFEVYYQPQIEVSSQKVVGVEALLRWHHPERGLVYPNDFIKIAEETRLIHQVGRWVINECCLQAKTWQDRALPPLRIGLNISGYQLMYDHVTEILREALSETKASVTRLDLQLEITENWLQVGSAVQLMLNQFSDMGLEVAIDDFGAGYSSLSQLKSLPIDAIKIDKSFLIDVPNNHKNTEIVSAMIAMAKNLGLKVIAEGVETWPQMQFLQELACDEVQGFLFSKAVTADQIETLLAHSTQIQPLLTEPAISSTHH